MSALPKQTCRCGTEFQPRRAWQKHCSDTCRQEAWRQQAEHGRTNAARVIRQAIDMLHEPKHDDAEVVALLHLALEDLS